MTARSVRPQNLDTRNSLEIQFKGKEKKKTGTPTIWLRWFSCNFNCNGFGQKDPTNPDSWDLPYMNIDLSGVNTMEELPVFKTGCDSSYSWSKRYAHLVHQEPTDVIAKKLRDLLPGQTFKHPKSRQYTDLAFTGGEPMMQQSGTVGVMQALREQGDLPKSVTIETNGTQKIRRPFADEFFKFIDDGNELFWSVSPKLFLSGELWDDAIKPEVVSEYNQLSNSGQLKYVCDGSDRAWDEVERATELFRNVGVEWPVWIMPVGARLEEQELTAADVAHGAIERGYNVAPRVHVYLFGNSIGT